VVLKCRRRASHRRPGATRPWARACFRRLAPPERTNGRSALAWCLAERAPPRCRGPRPAKPTPRGGRRSVRRSPASFTTALTIPTPTPCRGVHREGGRQTRCRCRARHRRQSLVLPRGTYSHCLSRAVGPRMFMCPMSQAGGTI
jgi:hypothetical protein